MNQLYARVFTQILDSSIAENYQVRHVFEDLLKLADDGIVDMTRQAIARRTNMPLDIVNDGIAILETPDPESRDPEEGGRRILRLDAPRDWGWRIVNWSKYEAVRSKADQRQKTLERVHRHRGRQPLVSPKPLSETTPAPAPAPEGNALQRSVTECNAKTVTPERAAVAAPASRVVIADESWLSELRADPAYQGSEGDRELAKARSWCLEHRKELTRRRFVNWLNRADRPMADSHNPPPTTPPPASQHGSGRFTTGVHAWNP